MAECGADTRTCRCSHPQQVHTRVPPEGVRRGGCMMCGDACQAFTAVPCANTAGRSGRCYRHGDRSLSGELHPRSVGIYSGKIAAALRRDYEHALQDEHLLSLREEIAVLRATAMHLLKRSNEHAWGGPAAERAMRLLSEAWDAYGDAEGATERLNARNRVAQRLDELQDAVASATAERKLRAEFRETAETLERLARSENTRVTELYSMISAERAFALRQAETTVLLEAIETHVPDREVRNAVRRYVSAKFAELAGRRDAPALDAGGGSSQPAGDPAASQP